ncbi:hypothetical protein VT84_23955 [Gemmata sp. SH-PL17]|uniref:hypothetical protein n=1 Tax=Gemmata sp. SH-PL17 TaxID=1630693 RepID=UPI0004B95AD9|nr:hypothetical protein [Gemmata sp. SH-PL17]AMV27476.1 hypothetical protein VT84_23955 [Gemmata sp. SH-PL17]
MVAVLLSFAIASAVPTDVALPRFTVPKLIPFEPGNPRPSDAQRELLEITEYLIKDAEETIEYLEKSGLDSTLLGEYRVELKKLIQLRSKLQKGIKK